ncbi:MAG: tetratricopeptide repeat protein [Candidatus Fermentibacteraceae bacterium]|nr:tetratricopeptide repeat protein [Candidatus Fermentibacteraceae bacterium]MBN2608219.1 tetratricopeptide repeat protein [Candidatus Fermentibacteraceae bacterium]
MGTERGSGIDDFEKRLEDASDDREKASVLADMAWAVKYADPAAAITLADRGIALSTTSGFEGNLPKCYMSKAVGLLHMSSFKAAEAAARTGLEIYRRMENEAGIRHALNVIGSIYFRWGRYSSALENYMEALRIHEKLNNAPDPGILSNIGAVYLQIGDTEKALECYSRVHDMAEEMDGPADLKTAALINMGEIFGRMGMNDAALENLSMAGELARANDMKQAMAAIEDNTGSVMTRLEKYDEAMEHFNLSLSMFRSLEDVKGEALVLCNMGKCALLDRSGRAMEFFEESQRIFRNLNDSQGASDTLIGIARVMVSQDRKGEALGKLAEALEIAGNKGLKPQLSEIHRDLSRIFENSGDHEKALMHIQLHYGIEEQLRSERAANRLRNLRVVYQVEEARKEAALYRVRNLELEEERQRLEEKAGVPQDTDQEHCPTGADKVDETGSILDMELELELLLERVHRVAGELVEMLTLSIEGLETVLEEGSLSPANCDRLERAVESIRGAFPLVKHLVAVKGADDELEGDAVLDGSAVLNYRSLGGFSTESEILVVEDDPQVAELLITAFEANGYPVSVASTIKRADEIVSGDISKIGCVFVDVLLPDGSGIDLLKRIRELDSSIPLLAGSGYPISGKDMEYLRENRIVFIQKPYNIDALMLNLSTMMPS